MRELLGGTRENSFSPTRVIDLPSCQIRYFFPVWPPYYLTTCALEVRLDPTDAFYVDTIHTDANPILSGGLGMWEACGHRFVTQ